MQKISELTRRDIFDFIKYEKISWHGRLDESDFLQRIYDLDALPSGDSRFKNARGDIWQHRYNNNDWEDDWIFDDPRFKLNHGDDQILLTFLCETLHPVVRSDLSEVEKIRTAYNLWLKHDGFEIIEKTKISGRPVFSARFTSITNNVPLNGLKSVLVTKITADYIVQQITRMELALEEDPSLAIGTAKELIETCCKTILTERNIEFDSKIELPPLVKLTSKELKLTPDDIPDAVAAAETIKKILGNLATITYGVAELRNKYGTGHGRHANSKGLSTRHAKLAVGAASTLAVFLLETHQEK